MKKTILKWGVGLLIPLILGLFIGNRIEHAKVAKKLKAYEKVKFDTESEKTALINQKIALELKVSSLKLDAKNKDEEIQYMKDHPQFKIKKVPKIEYVKVKEIEYVMAGDYELTFNSLTECYKRYDRLMVLHNDAATIWNDLAKTQRKIIDTHEKKDKVNERRIGAADTTIKFLSTRYYSTMYLSLSVSAGGYARVKHDMTFDYGFELLTVRLGFNKDIFRIALD